LNPYEGETLPSKGGLLQPQCEADSFCFMVRRHLIFHLEG
jgi:hypothetical protein